jgi:hypothetical protein
VREGNAEAEEGAEGCVMRLTGPFAGEGMRRGFLNVFQWSCSGLSGDAGSAGSLTCAGGRTGAAMLYKVASRLAIGLSSEAAITRACWR